MARTLPHAIAFFLLAALLLAGCATTTPPAPGEPEARQLYREALQARRGQDYVRALELYEELLARYPFGPYARHARLEIAYVHYRLGEPESAVAAAERYIKLYPRDRHVDYAYYLKGLAREPHAGALERAFGLDPADRDAEAAREAFRHYAELLRRFPRSRYAPDALRRMVRLRNALARHELHVARLYLRRRAYVAAANRAAGLLRRFDRTPSVPEALAVLEEAYRRLGLEDLAEAVRRVREHNRPRWESGGAG